MYTLRSTTFPLVFSSVVVLKSVELCNLILFRSQSVRCVADGTASTCSSSSFSYCALAQSPCAPATKHSPIIGLEYVADSKGGDQVKKERKKRTESKRLMEQTKKTNKDSRKHIVEHYINIIKFSFMRQRTTVKDL